MSGRPAWATDTTTTPYLGVTWLYRNTSTQKIHVLKIDLTQRTFRVRATAPPGGMGTDDFAVEYDCALAINGDFGTTSAPWRTTGLAMGDGVRWDNTNDGTLEGFTAFGRDNRVMQSPPADVLATPEPWMSEIVGGRPLVVDEGVALDAVPPYSREGCAPHFCDLHPRTAAGITEDGATLILATIDGRYTGAVGMTTKQVGTLMVEMGAWRALNMDGGGSTTMYIANEGGVVNNPSDGGQSMKMTSYRSRTPSISRRSRRSRASTLANSTSAPARAIADGTRSTPAAEVVTMSASSGAPSTTPS